MKHFVPLELSFWQHCTRLLRHWSTFSYKTRQLLPIEKREALADHIEQSEAKHTGEIAIAFETRLPYSYLARQARARERAWTVFSKMQVWDTPHDNGVLIYFLVAERRIEIVADRGIASLVSQDQWDAGYMNCMSHSKITLCMKAYTTYSMQSVRYWHSTFHKRNRMRWKIVQ